MENQLDELSFNSENHNELQSEVGNVSEKNF
jgi:hypothetical protein